MIELSVSSLAALPIQLFSRLTCVRRALFRQRACWGCHCLAWQMNILSRQPIPSATGRPPYWDRISSVTPADSRAMASRIRDHNAIQGLAGTDRIRWSDQAGICTLRTRRTAGKSISLPSRFPARPVLCTRLNTSSSCPFTPYSSPVSCPNSWVHYSLPGMVLDPFAKSSGDRLARNPWTFPP